jgi:hypothetical protein
MADLREEMTDASEEEIALRMEEERTQMVANAREQIALLCSKILEDPENKVRQTDKQRDVIIFQREIYFLYQFLFYRFHELPNFIDFVVMIMIQ